MAQQLLHLLRILSILNLVNLFKDPLCDACFSSSLQLTLLRKLIICEILSTYCVEKLTFLSCDLSPTVVKCDKLLKIAFDVAGALPKCQVNFKNL